MTKPQATADLSPLHLAFGAEIIAEDAVAVLGQHNWSMFRRPRLHVSAMVGDDGWAANAVGTARIKYPAVVQERLRFRIDVRPEVVTVRVGARSWFDVANGGDLTVKVDGTLRATISASDADNGNELTADMLTSAIGTGKLLVTIELARTAGASADNFLRDLRVEDLEITSSLPDPVNE